MSQIENRSVFDRNIERMKSIKPRLSFDPQRDLGEQRARMREKLLELIKVPPKETSPVPLVDYEDRTNPDYDRAAASGGCERGSRSSAAL